MRAPIVVTTQPLCETPDFFAVFKAMRRTRPVWEYLRTARSALVTPYMLVPLVVALLLLPLAVPPCQLQQACRFCKTECYQCVPVFGACTPEGNDGIAPPNCHLCVFCHLCGACAWVAAACRAPGLLFVLTELFIVAGIAVTIFCSRSRHAPPKAP